ncbi:MAG: RidA family protein [Acidobacteria bacterium]|nr:RidA family protein [Acidobacteriota bacterium]
MKMTIINPETMGMPSGYSNGVLVEGGKLLFVAGQIGWDHAQRIISDDFVEQFALALENVLTIVRAAGGEATSIARLLIFVTNKKAYTENLKQVGAVYRQLMGKHFPATALIEVSGLVEDLAQIEIEAIAMIG